MTSLNSVLTKIVLEERILRTIIWCYMTTTSSKINCIQYIIGRSRHTESRQNIYTSSFSTSTFIHSFRRSISCYIERLSSDRWVLLRLEASSPFTKSKYSFSFVLSILVFINNSVFCFLCSALNCINSTGCCANSSLISRYSHILRTLNGCSGFIFNPISCFRSHTSSFAYEVASIASEFIPNTLGLFFALGKQVLTITNKVIEYTSCGRLSLLSCFRNLISYLANSLVSFIANFTNLVQDVFTYTKYRTNGTNGSLNNILRFKNPTNNRNSLKSSTDKTAEHFHASSCGTSWNLKNSVSIVISIIECGHCEANFQTNSYYRTDTSCSSTIRSSMFTSLSQNLLHRCRSCNLLDNPVFKCSKLSSRTTNQCTAFRDDCIKSRFHFLYDSKSIFFSRIGYLTNCIFTLVHHISELRRLLRCHINSIFSIHSVCTSIKSCFHRRTIVIG